ncbi:sigma factor [Candidatus Phytoplasma prunorum]|uniref:sigma factor n=1 Tax=Candidatus Phytoplasma prunorum TaxID=47565 RepID=UPI002FEE6C25
MLNKLNIELETKVQTFLLDSQNLKLRDEIYNLCAKPLRSIARKFKLPPMLERNDLIQEGYLCLDDTIKKYQDNLSNFMTFFDIRARTKMRNLVSKTVGLKTNRVKYKDSIIKYIQYHATDTEKDKDYFQLIQKNLNPHQCSKC